MKVKSYYPKFPLSCLIASHSYFPSQLPGMTYRLNQNIADSKKLWPCHIKRQDWWQNWTIFHWNWKRGNTSAKRFPCGLRRWCVFPDNIVQENTSISVVQHSNKKTGHSFVRMNKNTPKLKITKTVWDIELSIISFIWSTLHQEKTVKNKNLLCYLIHKEN